MGGEKDSMDHNFAFCIGLLDNVQLVIKKKHLKKL